MHDSVHHHPEEKFIAAAPGRPCPICHHEDWCGFNSFLCRCMRVERGSFKTVMQKDGNLAYQHWLKPGAVNYTAVDDMSSSVKTAPVEILDRVYREFLSLLTLNQDHKGDLLLRGLTEGDIKKNGYKSIPRALKPWDICKRLRERGHDLYGIPGFYKKRSKNGGSFWTFLSLQSGYFIPMLDAKGRIQALQRRMDNPDKGGKYKMFSSSKKDMGCKSGTPAHLAMPAEARDRKVWITEGPLKADIACRYLGARVVAAMGAGNWVPVREMLRELNAEEVVLAYDMDFKTNAKVGESYKNLENALTKEYLVVYQATWDEVKGIDDALVGGKKITIGGR